MKISILHCRDNRWYAFIAKFIQWSANLNNQYPINHTAFLFEEGNKKYIVYELKKYGNIFTSYNRFLKKYKGEIWETVLANDIDNINIRKIIKSKKFRYSVRKALGAFDFNTKYKWFNNFLNWLASTEKNENVFYCSSSIMVLLLAKELNISCILNYVDIMGGVNEITPSDLFEYCKQNISVIRIK